MVDVSLVDVHLFQGAEEDDIGGRTIVDQNSLNPAVSDEQGDDQRVMVGVDQSGVLIVDEVEHQIGGSGLRMLICDSFTYLF